MGDLLLLKADHRRDRRRDPAALEIEISPKLLRRLTSIVAAHTTPPISISIRRSRATTVSAVRERAKEIRPVSQMLSSVVGILPYVINELAENFPLTILDGTSR